MKNNLIWSKNNVDEKKVDINILFGYNQNNPHLLNYFYYDPCNYLFLLPSKVRFQKKYQYS